MYRSIWDKLSIGASVACAIHCVALPLLFTTLPFAGIELMENIYMEILTVGISLLAGGWAVWGGFVRHHHNVWIPALFAAGIVLMLVGNFPVSEMVEICLKFTGAVLLVTAHIRNWKQCKKCTLCKTDHQSDQV